MFCFIYEKCPHHYSYVFIYIYFLGEKRAYMIIVSSKSLRGKKKKNNAGRIKLINFCFSLQKKNLRNWNTILLKTKKRNATKLIIMEHNEPYSNLLSLNYLYSRMQNIHFSFPFFENIYEQINSYFFFLISTYI